MFIIVLENRNYDETFGPTSQAPYLSKTLVSQGELLTHYYATGHLSNDNYVSMISGQAPDADNQGDCQVYSDFVGTGPDTNGQAVGQGCVFATFVKTISDQLEAQSLTWSGFMEDMGNTASREPATCGHPALNSMDGTQTATAADQYAARHNPFIYFHTIIDSPTCNAHDVPLSNLPPLLSSVSTTPNYVFITPNLCNDGHDTGCKNGDPGGLVSADAFLMKWVPMITSSPAYQQDGMLLIIFDEAEATSSGSTPSDSTACCNEIAGPNSPMPGISGPGGGRTGAVILSQFVKPGTVNDTPYNHYSMLRSIEDLFGLAHLGFAGQTGLTPFGSDVYNANPTPSATPTS